jgi:hypothetical protein
MLPVDPDPDSGCSAGSLAAGFLPAAVRRLVSKGQEAWRKAQSQQLLFAWIFLPSVFYTLLFAAFSESPYPPAPARSAEPSDFRFSIADFRFSEREIVFSSNYFVRSG